MALDFGIEIETLIPGETGFRNRVAEGLARDLTDAGAECAFEGYNHARRTRWKIVTDASLSAPTGYVGLEVVSPPMTDSMVPQIDSVCNVLRNVGAKTNRSCGFHVHIAARQLPFEALRRLAFLYLENEDVIDQLMPPSRRKNNNARYLGSLKVYSDVQRIRNSWNVEQLAVAIRSKTGDPHTANRFVKLNFTSYWKHGTVEFRQHSGTVDAEKIKRWVYFCQKLVDTAAIDGAIAAPIPDNVEAITRRIARAKQLRLIFEAVSRPQGATSIEVQAILGRRTPPALASDLARIGVAYTTDGRRNSHVVYKVAANAPPMPTLASLLGKLGMEEEHNAFWNQRMQELTRAHGNHEEEGGAVHD